MKSEAGVTIRSFNFPEDYQEVIDLWSRAGSGVHLGRSDSLEEISKKVRHDPDLFLVAEKDGQVVGAVLGGFDGRRGLAYHLAVSPSLRRSGIGSALMQALEDRLFEKGCLRAYLLLTKDNPDALNFYQANGWEELDLSILVKDLDMQ